MQMSEIGISDCHLLSLEWTLLSWRQMLLPVLVHCLCMWGDEYLGRAGVQLKLLDIFYIPDVLYICSLTIAL